MEDKTDNKSFKNYFESVAERLTLKKKKIMKKKNNEKFVSPELSDLNGTDSCLISAIAVHFSDLKVLQFSFRRLRSLYFFSRVGVFISTS